MGACRLMGDRLCQGDNDTIGSCERYEMWRYGFINDVASVSYSEEDCRSDETAKTILVNAAGIHLERLS